jgi:hypothetical protein
MSNPKPIIVASSTFQGKNRFEVKLFLMVTPEGTLLPLSRRFRRKAHYEVKLTLEYPTYQQELKFKQEATRYDQNNHIHWVDVDQLYEMRVRNCLRKWDLHEVVPELNLEQLHSVRGELEDDSFQMWQCLPPLLRRAIIDIVNAYLGPP